MPRLRFTKGHGTENDFVLVPDPDGTLPLTPDRVRALSDRRAGIGGDGVIRVVPTRYADDPHVRAQAGQAPWFMDYRNADGSLAEMCGNGARVFAAYLHREGLQAADRFAIATRSGPKRVRRTPQGYAVDLGGWSVLDAPSARAAGFTAVVQSHGGPELPALRLDVGNPHAVVVLPPDLDPAELDLSVPPHVAPTPEHGINVEFVRVLGPAHVVVRVHERGVGETRSCGTGAAAAALATRWWQQEASGDDDGTAAGGAEVTVDVRGGRLTVTPTSEGTVLLAGPAVLVADGTTTL
ncbi:MAG: diaminopimelate epimerase [Dermatophilaceae bacterium]